MKLTKASVDYLEYNAGASHSKRKSKGVDRLVNGQTGHLVFILILIFIIIIMIMVLNFPVRVANPLTLVVYLSQHSNHSGSG